jgi:hypothetical protein
VELLLVLKNGRCFAVAEDSAADAQVATDAGSAPLGLSPPSSSRSPQLWRGVTGPSYAASAPFRSLYVGIRTFISVIP